MLDDHPIMKYAIDRTTPKKYAIDRTTPKKERPPIVERCYECNGSGYHTSFFGGKIGCIYCQGTGTKNVRR